MRSTHDVHSGAVFPVAAVFSEANGETMRAAVLRDARRLDVCDVPRPQPAPHEVLVRVQAVGLCGTDLHIYAGHGNYNFDAGGRPVPLTTEPQILGHEIAGSVEAVGSAVDDMVPGDRVVLDQGRSCVGEQRSPACEYCASGDSHQCDFYGEHGITGLQGGFAEYIAVPAANAIRIETGLAAELAALTEPLGCIIHSCTMLGRVSARYTLGAELPERRVRSVLVCGAGPSGLLFVQYLRNVLRFDGLLLVSEPNARKRALAERFGADTIDPSAVDPVQAVQERTGGRRLELLIEASGVGSVVAQIPGLIRKQGTVLLYGHGHTGVSLGVMNHIQFLEPTLISPAGASGGFEPDGRPSTYVRALRLIESGSVEVAALITHRYPSLESIRSMFERDYHHPDYVKGVLNLVADGAGRHPEAMRTGPA
jgi:threonine dehydrogenase-like Zn-dependent dehydrogenase